MNDDSTTAPLPPPVTPAEIRQAQRDFFRSGITRDLNFRKNMLTMLLGILKDHEKDFIAALATDLGKSEFEAYSNEIGLVYTEIRYSISRLGRWSKPRRVGVDLPLMPGSAWIQPEPYGSVLIMAPWNYPMQLLFMPLVGAMAAGNTAVLKPSELAPRTAEVSRRVITENFDPAYLALLEGGPEVATTLIDQDFDYIFFTGSVPVGRKIMEQASKFLTPLTLELGGKSPALVLEDADLDLAAKKIVWGKFNNAGQTCVAPDYVLVHESQAPALLEAMKKVVLRFYGDQPSSNPAYGRIVSQRHFDRLDTMLQGSQVWHGGKLDRDQKFLEPTILFPVDWKDPVMADEIFGPLLPVLTYTDLDEAVSSIQDQPKPLAMYVFGRNVKLARRVVNAVSFGGGAINSTILHVASHRLPFGGVGPSGLGSYHGKASFDTFSHHKSMLKQPGWLDLGLAYPDKPVDLKLLRRILR